MKILITSDLDTSVVTGVNTSVFNLKRELEKKGHEVRILTLSDSLHDKKGKENYRLGSFHIDFIYPGLSFTLPRKRRLTKELLEWHPDIIHSQMEGATLLYAFFLSRKARIPHVHTWHTDYSHYFHYLPPSYLLGKKGMYAILRFISKKFDMLIVPSQKTYDEIKIHRMHTPLKIIPTGIHFELYAKENPQSRNKIRQRYGIAENECIFLFIGRTGKEKNIEELIRYCDSDRLKNIRLMVVGSGTNLSHLRQLALKSRHPERFIFTGLIKPDNLPMYYHAADIFVSASTSETQGLTYLEAVASSLPLLCRNDKALKNIIKNEESGFIYNNRAEFLKYASKLCKHPELRKNIAQKALLSIGKQYTDKAFTQSVEKIYLKCIADYQRKK